jgi:hypothetical protein
MKGKKFKMLILGVLGLLSFGVSFMLSRNVSPSGETSNIMDIGHETGEIPPELVVLKNLAKEQKADLRPKERQLDELVREVRARIQQLDRRERILQQREKRLEVAAEQLKAQGRQLEELRVKLVAAVDPLQRQRKSLLRERALITAQEVTNLKNAAKMYGRMEPSNAARILLAMVNSGNLKMASKIIHYLPDKNWAAIMDEIKQDDKAVEIIKQNIQVLRMDKKS